MPELSSKPVDPVKGATPTDTDVRKFHTNADTDGTEQSLHHTLGSHSGQASPGNHDHRGGSSVLLLDGVTVSGSRSTDAWRISVMALLVDLGAIDATTP